MTVTINGTTGITTPDLESTGPIIGTTGTFSGTVTSNGLTTSMYPIIRETAKTLSGTSTEFTGIPSWVKRITIMISGLSTSGSSFYMLQLGSTTYTVTGYASVATSSGGNGNETTGFILTNGVAAGDSFSGAVQLLNLSGNIWVESGACSNAGGSVRSSAGNVTIGGVLDRIRITTVNGTDTFDAGTINILYE